MTTVPQTPNSRYLSDFKSITVVGLGATGFSVVRYLCAHGLSPNVVDSRAEPPLAEQLSQGFAEVKTSYGSLNSDLIKNADLIVLSPGVSRREPAVAQAKNRGASVVGDIELFLAHNQAPVIAITGSNGKSTVTTLVGQLCAAAGFKPLVAGNIGKPALDAITDNESYGLAVLELSSFQLETTRQVPADAAAILNISEDHMDRYDSMGDYVLAKARILRGAKRAVLPRQEPQLAQITNISQKLTFGLDAPSQPTEYGVSKRKSGRWLARGSQKIMHIRDIALVGMHNVSNVLAALALVEHLDIASDTVVQTIRQFHGLPHRMQTVTSHAGVTWVNDSKATNVGATASALSSLESPVIWLAGGEGKGADFTPLSLVINQVKTAILFGADAAKIAHAIEDYTVVLNATSLEETVQMAAQQAANGDIVLLSPACASFDMFKNFEHRGEAFSAAVNRLVGSDSLIGSDSGGADEQ